MHSGHVPAKASKDKATMPPMADLISADNKQIVVTLGAAKITLLLGHEEIYRLISAAKHSERQRAYGAHGALVVEITPPNGS